MKITMRMKMTNADENDNSAENNDADENDNG